MMSPTQHDREKIEMLRQSYKDAGIYQFWNPTWDFKFHTYLTVERLVRRRYDELVALAPKGLSTGEQRQLDHLELVFTEGLD